VKAKVQIGEKSVAVGAVFANSKIKSIEIEAKNIDIHDIIPPLKGKFSISYNSGTKDLESEGTDIGPSDPEMEKALKVSYTYKKEVFKGTFTPEMDAPFTVGPMSGHIKKCEVTCTIGGGKTAFAGGV